MSRCAVTARWQPCTAITSSCPSALRWVLNSKCEAIRALAAVKDPELQKLLAKQYFDIARMSTRPLENEELSAFIRQSYQLAARLAEKAD